MLKCKAFLLQTSLHVDIVSKTPCETFKRVQNFHQGLIAVYVTFYKFLLKLKIF